MPKINCKTNEIYFKLEDWSQKMSSFAKEFKGKSREHALENTKC
jgi:hypothetical protein